MNITIDDFDFNELMRLKNFHIKKFIDSPEFDPEVHDFNSLAIRDYLTDVSSGRFIPSTPNYYNIPTKYGKISFKSRKLYRFEEDIEINFEADKNEKLYYYSSRDSFELQNINTSLIFHYDKNFLFLRRVGMSFLSPFISTDEYTKSCNISIFSLVDENYPENIIGYSHWVKTYSVIMNENGDVMPLKYNQYNPTGINEIKYIYDKNYNYERCIYPYFDKDSNRKKFIEWLTDNNVMLDYFGNIVNDEYLIEFQLKFLDGGDL